MTNDVSASWPALDYTKFKTTGYLLHMAMQAIGKHKLFTPFEPHWGNVAFWLTARGFTTGIIPFEKISFSIDVDMIDHCIIVTTSLGLTERVNIESMSVADLTAKIFSALNALKKCQINLTINPMPQEIPNPIPFHEDTEIRQYDRSLAKAWWQIVLSTYWVIKLYHSHFDGETPDVGFMWGTFDLRDARFNGKKVPTTGMNAGYIRRNAMDEAQIEVGFWPGNEAYPKPAFYSFTYPQPAGIETASIKPQSARWDASMMEFVLDYDDLRQSKNPEKDLLDFFESSYKVGSELAGWDKSHNTSGSPK